MRYSDAGGIELLVKETIMRKKLPTGRFVALALLPALVAGCTANARNADADSRAARDAVKLSKALEGLTPGKPQSCIFQGRQNIQTESIGDTLLYKVGRKLVYRNDTTGGCNRAAQGDALVTRNFSSELCSGQIVQTVDFTIGHQTGSCALREFVPYRAK